MRVFIHQIENQTELFIFALYFSLINITIN